MQLLRERIVSSGKMMKTIARPGRRRDLGVRCKLRSALKWVLRNVLAASPKALLIRREGR
jgi:hypothetical protein